MIKELQDLRFVFVTGKGGAGKTTVTAALALLLAARNKRVLVAMCGAQERLSGLLEAPPIGTNIISVRPNIDAVNIQPETALAEYGHMVLKMRALYKAVFENKFIRSFFRATPGLYEWAVLGKAWFHTTEKREDGSHRYDIVLFDAPATGHGLDMLRGPKVIVDVAPPGLLRREAAKAWSLFTDPSQSGVVVVTIPEEMPVTETFDLLDALRNDLKLPVARLVVNAILPPLFSPAERAELLTPRTLDPSMPGTEALGSGARRARRETIQQDALIRLRKESNLPLSYLPFVFEEVNSLKDTNDLALRLT